MSTSDAAGASKPLAIVTGANTGIGLHTAVELSSRGFHVVLACRSLERGADALAAARRPRPQDPFQGSAELKRLDLASFASVQAFAADFKGRSLDLLVCNAGLNSASANQEPEGQLSEDKVDVMYQTNYLSHFLLTLLLMPSLRRARGRVINISSVIHRSASLDDFEITCKVRKPYRSLYGLSKLAQIVSSYALQARYGEEVAFHCVNPGGVGSDIWRSYAGWQQKLFSAIMISPKTAASTVVAACTAKELEAPSPPRYWNGYIGANYSVLAEFWSPFGPAREVLVESKPSQDHQDPKLAEQLWEQSLAEIRAAGVELDV